jgi:CubicO group peptidase (beta-lactamase class C family)
MELNCSLLGPGFERVVEEAIHAVEPVANAGIAIAVIKDGQLCFAGGVGLRDRNHGKKVDAHTCFAIGSATKAFTSMAISMHVEEGNIDLNVPVKQYLPDFKMKDTAVANQMTLLDILSHRTGLPRNDALWYLGPFSRSELFYRLQYLDLVPGAFGNAFLYNNMMYMVAGNLLENLFGTSWEDTVKARILDPLGMTATCFSLADLLDRPNHAKAYVRQHEIPLKDFNNIGPAGEINSTAQDMAKWVLLFLNKGVARISGAEIISPAALEKMYTGLTDIGDGTKYGLGWIVGAIDGKRLVFHQGDADGSAAYVSFMPDDGLGVVVLTNQHCTPDLIDKWPDQISTRIYDFLLNDQLTGRVKIPRRLSNGGDAPGAAPAEAAGPAAAPPPIQSPGDYTGMFSHPAYGDITVSRAAGDLKLSYYSSSWPLHPSPTGGFTFDLYAFGAVRQPAVTFSRTATGDVDTLGLLFDPRLIVPIPFTKR